MTQFLQTPDGQIPRDVRLSTALTTRAMTPEVWERDGADAHWLALERDEVVACASLWWRRVPTLPGETLGLVGHYAAVDRRSGRALLDHAVHELASRGCTRVVGPMDGSTWRSYRLVTERGELLPFFLEPDTPDDWPSHFRDAGFDVLASYTSALVDPIPPPHPRATEASARLDALGYVIRPLDVTRAAHELDALYDVSAAAFAENYLYTPITREEFHAQYAAILPVVDPRLVLIAEHKGRVVGYVFAVADLLEARRTGRARTAIVKTLAVHPDHGGLGLGGVLVERCQRVAESMGLTRVIHALMFESNVSQRISQRYGATCRRYALFSRATR